MHIINLRKHYPHYTVDIFLEVSDEVYEIILLSIRQENNCKSRMYYHKTQYSLDCNDGIENDALHRMPSPEEIFMQKVSLEQLYKAFLSLPAVAKSASRGLLWICALLYQLGVNCGITTLLTAMFFTFEIGCIINSPLKFIISYFPQYVNPQSNCYTSIPIAFIVSLFLKIGFAIGVHLLFVTYSIC